MSGEGTRFKIKDNMAQNGQIKPIQPNVTEERYYIHPKLREDLEGIVATVQHLDRFGTEMGHRNYLFVGPPGTGKTLGVQYVATKLQCPLYDAKGISNPQQVSQLYHQLREIAENRKQKVILMLDEVDKFSSREEIVDPTQQQTLNQLLAEMDGVDSNNGIFVFGMTNKADKLDNALRRPGRFSKEIEFMPPDKEGRLAILRIHANGKGGHMFKVDDGDLQYAAGLTFGYTGADLRGLLDEAFTLNVLRGDDKLIVSRSDIDKAMKKTRPSALRDMPFREPQKKLDSIGGYESHKDVMRRVFDRSNGTMALFYGPAGTGKTEFAEALAGEYGFNYIVISGSEPEDKFVGETGKKIEKYLTRARQLSPCVLLFDEVDALVEKKGAQSWKSSWTGLLQSKLSKPIEGVYMIGTMNRPDLINDTFVQRFPHRLYFGMPNPTEQEAIWRKYLPNGIEAKALVEANGKLTGRNIAHADLVVRDYGLEPSVEIYRNLIANIQSADGIGYEEIRNQVGDSVRDYDNVKRFLVKSEGEIKDGKN